MDSKLAINYDNAEFEEIRHLDENGAEFWYARELQEVLEYTQWRNFEAVIEKAKEACRNSNHDARDHFADISKMVELGSGAVRELEDIELSRYACYLIVQNGDPSKEVIAMGQTYFAIKTRQQELSENYEQLTENQKRIAMRGGLGMQEIHEKKKLKKSQKILDHMGSTELAANLFRATQTDEKLRRDEVHGRAKANETHFQVGKKVRQTIKELGGTMPENLSTPDKSIKQVEKMIAGKK